MKISFDARIEVNRGKTVNFKFARIYTLSGLTYFVQVSNPDGTYFNFSMKQNGSKGWIIINPDFLPTWTREAEDELSTIIQSNIAQ